MKLESITMRHVFILFMTLFANSERDQGSQETLFFCPELAYFS